MKKCSKILFISLLLLAGIALPLSHVFAQLTPQLNTVSVQAIVPPHQSDFQFSFSADAGTSVHQDQIIRYEITYGASTSAGLSTGNTIVVHYSGAKDQLNEFIVDYVNGSATNAYGNIQPVIDLTQRTITWTIPNLPEGTVDQKVSFQLKISSIYPGPSPIPFITTASMSNDYATMPDQIINQDFIFDQSLITPAPTNIPIPTPTIVPQKVIIPLKILNISLNSVSDKTAQIGVTTNKPARTIVTYGTNQNALTLSAQNKTFKYYSTVDLSSLTPDTQYYFQVNSIDLSGRSLRSDIYTFTTAKNSSLQNLLNNQANVTILNGNTVLLSQLLTAGSVGSSVVNFLPDTTYQVAYTLALAPVNATFELIIKNDSGVQRTILMTAKDADTYIAQLRTASSGTYDIYIVQTDEQGNVMSRKVSAMRVINPLQVIDAKSQEAIGDARVFLSINNPQTHKFEALNPSQLDNMNNPEYTDMHGIITYNLPLGRYRAEASALGHQNKTVNFTIGTKEGQGYPIIALETDPLNLTYLFFNVKDRLVDSSVAIGAFSTKLATSIRLYNFSALGGLGSLTWLSFVFFKFRTNIRLTDIWPYFIFHLSALQNRHKKDYLFGVIYDKNGNPAAGARIEVVHPASQIISTYTLTDKLGRFQIKNSFREAYIKLIISKEGYPIVEIVVPTDTSKAIIVKFNQPKTSVPQYSIIREFAGAFYEVFLLLNLLADLAFLVTFGVVKTLPFVMLSLFNLLLWIFYQRKSHLN